MINLQNIKYNLQLILPTEEKSSMLIFKMRPHGAHYPFFRFLIHKLSGSSLSPLGASGLLTTLKGFFFEIFCKYTSSTFDTSPFVFLKNPIESYKLGGSRNIRLWWWWRAEVAVRLNTFQKITRCVYWRKYGWPLGFMCFFISNCSWVLGVFFFYDMCRSLGGITYFWPGCCLWGISGGAWSLCSEITKPWSNWVY